MTITTNTQFVRLCFGRLHTNRQRTLKEGENQDAAKQIGAANPAISGRIRKIFNPIRNLA